MLRLIKLGLLVSLFCVFSFSLSSSASALSGADWKPGRIIDDGIFYSPGSLSINDVQNTLNARLYDPVTGQTGVCDTNGVQPYAGTTRGAFGASRGYPPPYTCLKDYSQSIPSQPANQFCSAIGGGNLSAAHIIYQIAQACRINSATLIVLLEKEQSLVSDPWPAPYQYLHATGYGCPDTALCDAQYNGFFNQVYNAAWQFNNYATNSSSFRYKPYQNNTIQYNPNAGCGSSTVYIENKATAGLYNYTPYQPNASALNNLYGSGDNCGAYGNRNFWRIYNDWFGNSNGSNYTWSLISQQVFTDSTKTQAAGTQNLGPGQKVYAVIKVKNTGVLPWLKGGANPVRLGTSRPQERSSAFCDPTWPSCTRPAALNETQVDPSQIGTFEFWLNPPASPTSHNEYFTPVVEGQLWMPDIGLFYSMSSQGRVYSWQMTGQYAYTDASKTTPKNMDGMMPGEKAYIGFTAKNTGNVAWKNNGPNTVMVGGVSPLDRVSAFAPGSNWLSASRPTTFAGTADILPGQTATFEFWMTAPAQAGVRNERFGLIANGLTWFNDPGLSYYTRVAPVTYSWQMTGQYAYTDASKTTPKNMDGMMPGEKAYIGFTAKNTGNVAWKNNGPNTVMVGGVSPLDRVSAFAPGSNWLSASRPTTFAGTADILPGQTATFEFWMTAPAQAGVRNERFGLIANGLTWFNDPGLSYYTRVAPVTYSWQMTGQYAYTDASKTTPKNMDGMMPGEKAYIGFTAKNTGNVAWKNNGPNTVMVGGVSPLDRVSAFAPGSNWLSASRPTTFAGTADILPGQTATFEFWMTAPAQAGVRNERFGLIANGLTWFNDPGLSYYTRVL